MRHALILAGGSGTRLWPYSTAAVPKQLVPMLSGRSLLELAVERAGAVADEVWLGAGEQLRAAVTEVPGLRPDRLILEPSARDTLPAVALGCATILGADPDAVVAVLTSDHLIEPVQAFAASLAVGFELAETAPDVLVTFGVVPTSAATGFGYLELGGAFTGARPGGPAATRPDLRDRAAGVTARQVSRFREKPHRSDAETFLAAGPDRFLWNSGMFVWRAETLLAAVAAFEPDTARRARAVAGGDLDQWAEMPRQSVDYGVMEPASASSSFSVAAVPMEAGWLDVGSWPAYGDAVGRDAERNAVAGTAVLLDSSGCVVASAADGHLVALVGCSDLVVVHTAQATLVMPADQAQRVKDLHALVAQQRPDLA